MKIAVILLAAGRSSRMGMAKGLLTWKGKPLFEHQLSVLEESPLFERIAVVGGNCEDYLTLAKNYTVQTVRNTSNLGKCSSIRCGVQAISTKVDAILISSVDQPLNQKVIKKLIDAFVKKKSLITVPVFDGKRGHPILFSGEIMEELLSLQEEALGLRSILQKYKDNVSEINMNSMEIHLNFNTPDQYEKAIKEVKPCS